MVAYKIFSHLHELYDKSQIGCDALFVESFYGDTYFLTEHMLLVFQFQIESCRRSWRGKRACLWGQTSVIICPWVFIGNQRESTGSEGTSLLGICCRHTHMGFLEVSLSSIFNIAGFLNRLSTQLTLFQWDWGGGKEPEYCPHIWHYLERLFIYLFTFWPHPELLKG